MKDKLMMKLFIASEGFFFISLMMAYIYLWLNPGFTEQAKMHLNITSTGFFSIFLVASSFTYRQAEKKYRKREMLGLKLWLSATLILGIVFLFGQGKEYYSLVSKQVTIEKNVFTTGFYTLTGFHVLHVIMGIILLGILLFLSTRKEFGYDRKNILSAAGIYWHFVDIVWLFIFTMVYVVPKFIL